MKKLVLLGGGQAHLHVLRALAREPLPAVRVTLVAPFAEIVYPGMVAGVVAGHYAAADAAIALAPLAARAGAAFIIQAPMQLDAVARSLTLGDGRVLGYDALSIDTGALIDREQIPGAREHALIVRPIEHFVRLLQPLLALAERRVLRIVVVGADATGVELALALQHRLGERAVVSLVTGGTPPLPGEPRPVRARALRALKRSGVTLFEDECREIAAGHLILGSGARLACDAPLLALGARPPDWLAASGLALDEHGFVSVATTCQSRSHPEVFCAGSATLRGVCAMRAGAPLAFNLRRFMAGGALQPHVFRCPAIDLLACGDRRAIASWGRWSAEGRWVWRWKDRIDRVGVARYR